MGFGITELIIVLVIVILLFGTKKLRGMGSDLGGALKNFRGAMKDIEEPEQPEQPDNKEHKNNSAIIEGEVDKTAEK